jgi:hypothetical protein
MEGIIRHRLFFLTAGGASKSQKAGTQRTQRISREHGRKEKTFET